VALIVERLDPGGTSSLTRVLIRLTVPVQYNANLVHSCVQPNSVKRPSKSAERLTPKRLSGRARTSSIVLCDSLSSLTISLLVSPWFMSPMTWRSRLRRTMGSLFS
jgi:hypothetical protein